MTTTLKYGKTEYTVTKNETPRIPYTLTGVRGAKYDLMRNVPNPHMLFAVNGASFTKGTPFTGRWFTDKTGTLELL